MIGIEKIHLFTEIIPKSAIILIMSKPHKLPDCMGIHNINQTSVNSLGRLDMKFLNNPITCRSIPFECTFFPVIV